MCAGFWTKKTPKKQEKPNTNLFNKSNEEKLLGDNHKIKRSQHLFLCRSSKKFCHYLMKYRVGNMNGGEMGYSSGF